MKNVSCLEFNSDLIRLNSDLIQAETLELKETKLSKTNEQNNA